MLDAIYRFIASPFWDITMVLLLIWGVASLFVAIFGLAKTRRAKIATRAGIAAMFGSIVFSMVFEDFLPGLASGRTSWSNAVGMAGILAGVCLFAHGGYVFVRDTFRRLEAAGTPVFGRQKKGRAPVIAITEPVPVAGWLSVWTPALVRLAGGALLLVAGASLNNANRFPLAWLWGPLGV